VKKAPPSSYCPFGVYLASRAECSEIWMFARGVERLTT